MIVVADCETDGLNPTKIWVLVAEDLETGEQFIFEEPYKDDYKRLSQFIKQVKLWIGHNFLCFDLPALNRLVPDCAIDYRDVVDTLVVSRLLDFNIAGGHSLSAWGDRLGIPKRGHEEWDRYSEEMKLRCLSDVSINKRLYLQEFQKYVHSGTWRDALRTEHDVARYCWEIQQNGFWFNYDKAKDLYTEIDKELDILNTNLKDSFRPKSLFLKEYNPKSTKHGTISRTSVPRGVENLTEYLVGAPFSTFRWEEFNPGSNKQRIDRLWEAGWKPIDKTKGHSDFLREVSKGRLYGPEIDKKREHFARYGWGTTETNLETLPDTAPQSAKTLVRWLLVAARKRKLDEWFKEYNHETHRIHGTVNPIGTWTHRASHTDPNLGNVFKFDAENPEKTPYSDRLRALFGAPEDRYLIGVDAEGIQLRILGHYMDDTEFIQALVNGRKEDGTDPHSVNKRAIGDPCRSRDAAKTFIYAWILGAGVARVQEVLDCSREEAKEAGNNFLDRYPGLRYIKTEIVPQDARRGYFQGFDGRYVLIKGDDLSSKEHYALGGYLQNGEAVIMKRAQQIWYPKLVSEKIPFWFVNWVHDEYQIETIRCWDTARYVAGVVADSIATVGSDLKLRCPMAGSILNAHKKIAIGDNWMETH